MSKCNAKWCCKMWMFKLLDGYVINSEKFLTNEILGRDILDFPIKLLLACCSYYSFIMIYISALLEVGSRCWFSPFNAHPQKSDGDIHTNGIDWRSSEASSKFPFLPLSLPFSSFVMGIYLYISSNISLNPSTFSHLSTSLLSVWHGNFRIHYRKVEMRKDTQQFWAGRLCGGDEIAKLSIRLSTESKRVRRRASENRNVTIDWNFQHNIDFVT